MDIIEQMLAAQKMTEHLVAELRAAGMDRSAIASVLFNEAGALWRVDFPKESDRRVVIGHAAEVAITGSPVL